MVFENTPVQAESLLHRLEQALGSINLYINANKRESMCLKQKGAISTLSGKPLKFVAQFTYLGSNISSIENNVNIPYLPNPSAWAGYDTRSIFKWGLTGLNSEFSFS